MKWNENLEGIKLEAIKQSDGYRINLESLNNNKRVDLKDINLLLDALLEYKKKLIGEINEDFYDKEYYGEGKVSEKNGLCNYEKFSKTFAVEHADRIDYIINRILYRPDPIGFETFRVVQPKNELSILEIGCAFGWTVDELRNRGYLANGIDISEYAISRYPRIYLQKKDIIKNDISGEYHLIYSFATIEHIKKEDVPTLFENINKLLFKNGILFATIDNVWGRDISHQVIEPREWWEQQARENGFELIKDLTSKFEAINGYCWRKNENSK